MARKVPGRRKEPRERVRTVLGRTENTGACWEPPPGAPASPLPPARPQGAPRQPRAVAGAGKLPWSPTSAQGYLLPSRPRRPHLAAGPRVSGPVPREAARPPAPCAPPGGLLAGSGIVGATRSQPGCRRSPELRMRRRARPLTRSRRLRGRRSPPQVTCSPRRPRPPRPRSLRSRPSEPSTDEVSRQSFIAAAAERARRRARGARRARGPRVRAPPAGRGAAGR